MSEPRTEHGRKDVALGRHGGPVLTVDGGSVELSIFEAGVPPRFRLYFLDQAKKDAVPPARVEVETIRPDGARQRFEFRAREGYL